MFEADLGEFGIPRYQWGRERSNIYELILMCKYQ